MVGGFRGFDTDVIVSRSFTTHVLGRLGADTAYSTFICAPESDGRKLPLALSQTLHVVYESYASIASMEANYTIRAYATARGDQYISYLRLRDCYDGAVRAAQARGKPFTHFIRARPDSQWLGPMPHLHSLAPAAISLRARTVFANLTLPADAFAWPDPCFNRLTSCGNDPSVAEDLRCVLPDDGFAVVPAVLAPVYFLAESPSAAAVAALADAEAKGLQPANTGNIIYKSRATMAGCARCGGLASAIGVGGRGEGVLSSYLHDHDEVTAVSLTPFRFRWSKRHPHLFHCLAPPNRTLTCNTERGGVIDRDYMSPSSGRLACKRRQAECYRPRDAFNAAHRAYLEANPNYWDEATINRVLCRYKFKGGRLQMVGDVQGGVSAATKCGGSVQGGCGDGG